MRGTIVMQKKCTFYIARHGETEWNLKGFYQGQKDSILTEMGIQQAKDVAQKLKNIKFAAAFSSDLLRAKQTAEIIALEHEMIVETKKILRERNYGRLEGTSIAEAQQELKDTFRKFSELSADIRFKTPLIDGSESDESIATRLVTFIRETSVAYPGKNVLVVCHGGIMRAFLIHMGFAPKEEMRALAIDNAGYFVLESDGVDFFFKETVGVHKGVMV